jgi:hypothetical protein
MTANERSWISQKCYKAVVNLSESAEKRVEGIHHTGSEKRVPPSGMNQI